MNIPSFVANQVALASASAPGGDLSNKAVGLTVLGTLVVMGTIFLAIHIWDQWRN